MDLCSCRYACLCIIFINTSQTYTRKVCWSINHVHYSARILTSIAALPPKRTQRPRHHCHRQSSLHWCTGYICHIHIVRMQLACISDACVCILQAGVRKPHGRIVRSCNNWYTQQQHANIGNVYLRMNKRTRAT